MQKRTLKLPFAVIAVLGAGLAAPLPVRARGDADGDPFVRVDGARFVLAGKPFRFVGANLAVMHHPRNRDGAEELLTEAARDGVRVARIWAFGEGAAGALPWQKDFFLFRAGPTGWIDAASEHLDRVIAAAGRVGIRLVVTLSNNWADYGGVPQYLRWSGQWRAGSFGAEDRFYEDGRARAAYRAHVERLVGRTNRITGIPYRDDPTILAWELMNESQVSGTAAAKARRAWIVDMARLVRSLDPNHLVSAGVSLYRLTRERREWVAVCALPEIAFCDGHLYPEQTLPGGGGGTATGGGGPAAALERAVDDFVEMAQHRVGKPFVLGEFGITGGEGGLWRGEPRAVWIRRTLDRLAFDGAAGGLLWIYQPAGTAVGGHAVVIGDPGSEDVRTALRAAAAALAAAPVEGGSNPALGRGSGTTGDADEGLATLHTEVSGNAARIPFLELAPGSGGRQGRGGAWRAEARWDPPRFDRAFWEAAGVYAGGALEHAWGTETGWFEFAFETPVGVAAQPSPARIVVRARVSSEFPGALAPPDGVSTFSVTLDDLPLGTVLAPRDDGRGRWVTIRSADPGALRAAATPGRHRLRFTVADGPRAHGLCLYGRPGPKASERDRAAEVELMLEGTTRAAAKP
jgi:mannan endo-1,4-beta-mannosidase